MIILMSYNLLIILDAITITVKMFWPSSVDLAAKYNKIHFLNVNYKLCEIEFIAIRRYSLEVVVIIENVNKKEKLKETLADHHKPF